MNIQYIQWMDVVGSDWYVFLQREVVFRLETSKCVLYREVFLTSTIQRFYVCTPLCRFERCWPAMVKDTHGVVMVHNPDQPQHEKELERWSENAKKLRCISLRQQ